MSIYWQAKVVDLQAAVLRQELPACGYSRLATVPAWSKLHRGAGCQQSPMALRRRTVGAWLALTWGALSAQSLQVQLVLVLSCSSWLVLELLPFMAVLALEATALIPQRAIRLRLFRRSRLRRR